MGSAMTFTPEKIIRIAFAGLLAILVGVVVLAYDSTRILVANEQSVRHAQTMQAGLWELLTSVNTAEISQGRFVMTGDDRVLGSLQTAEPRIKQLGASLTGLVSDSPAHLAALDGVLQL